MKKITVLSLLIFSTLLQSQTEEYDWAFQKSLDIINNSNVGIISVGDSIETSYLNKLLKFNNSLIGIRYPNLELQLLGNDSIYLYSINADITLLNFNYYYCDDCVKKIDSYIDYKNKSQKSVKIICVFSDDTSDVNILLEKYKKDDVLFVANFKDEKKYYLLNNGTPATFVLDKNKNIIQFLAFEDQTLKP